MTITAMRTMEPLSLPFVGPLLHLIILRLPCVSSDLGLTCHLASRIEWLKDDKTLEYRFGLISSNNSIEYTL